jgi:hypothetical protein
MRILLVLALFVDSPQSGLADCTDGADLTQPLPSVALDPLTVSKRRAFGLRVALNSFAHSCASKSERTLIRLPRTELVGGEKDGGSRTSIEKCQTGKLNLSSSP